MIAMVVAEVATMRDVRKRMGILAISRAIRYPSKETLDGRVKAELNISRLVLNDEIRTQTKGATEMISTKANTKYAKIIYKTEDALWRMPLCRIGVCFILAPNPKRSHAYGKTGW